MTKIIFFLSLLLYSTENWKRTENPHFNIFYEGKWEVNNINIELERIYTLMRMDLSFYAPWIKTEKINIYIYSTYENYLNGIFKPPQWSKGLAIIDKRTIVVYNDKKKDYLIPTISHELTHLFFESYFNQKLKKTPVWLDEGLAVYMEDKAYENQRLWERALKNTPLNSFFKFNDFFKTNIDTLKDREISIFYIQSYGIVRYLFENKRLLFYKFSREILEGKKLEKALWDNYRIIDNIDFEYKWFRWLGDLKRKEHEDEFEFKPFKKIKFKEI